MPHTEGFSVQSSLNKEEPKYRAEPWQNRAACKDTDPAYFYSKTLTLEERAQRRSLCNTCEVLFICKESALAEEENLPGEITGFRGGMSVKERKKEIYRRKAAKK